MEAKLKHLEFVQQTITRMAANSFFLKGWSITLISALAVLAQKDTNTNFWVIALVPATTFWGLDGYFLRQEKLFRKLYDSVRIKSEAEIDFSMDVSPFQNQVGSWLRLVFSSTLVAFHLTILLAVLLIAWFVNQGK